MDIEFLGGAREIGRSAILVDDSLLLDFKRDSENPPRFPIGDADPEAVVVSHGHLDHVGSIPSLLFRRRPSDGPLDAADARPDDAPRTRYCSVGSTASVEFDAPKAKS